MPINRNPAWVYRGKSVRQVIEELRTFENLDLELLISIDCGDTRLPVDEINNIDEKFLVLKQEENSLVKKRCGPHNNSIGSFVEKFQSIENQELEVRLSINSDENHKPISLIGKKNGSCVLMSCLDYYDVRN